MQYCAGCHTEKEAEEFKPDSRLAGGRDRVCRTCRRAGIAQRTADYRATLQIAPAVLAAIEQQLAGADCFQCGRENLPLAEARVYFERPLRHGLYQEPTWHDRAPSTIGPLFRRFLRVICTDCHAPAFAPPWLPAAETDEARPRLLVN